MRAQQPRLAFGANSGVGEAAVLPVFVTKDPAKSSLISQYPSGITFHKKTIVLSYEFQT
jgi:hypothetical protein